MIELNVENQPNLSKQEPVTKSQSSSLNSMALFWDIENVRVPKGKTAEVLTQIVRSTFSNGYNEIEFVVVCDVTKETEKDIKDLIKSKVKLIHISSTSKNAAYEKLKQSVRRFADIHGNTATVALISSDINFAPDLSDLRHRKKIKQEPVTKFQSSLLNSMALFWDIENVRVPKGKTAEVLTQIARSTFSNGYNEIEFVVVCDVTKETEKDIKDLIKSKVKLIHISSTSKNAADEKLKQSVRRFADIHGNTATVALISSDINFAPDLSVLRHRKKMYVILLHNNHPSKALISCANEHHNLMKLMKRTSESAKISF
ncbi:hypothetical protein HCN44_009075 [Aphidius gifuensis]|uniref:NYN domain-containing protein n=1 Tax=Aphidius gifuensis TaxID=684658 RepID=A0A834Y3F0_APHGI|nr:hypothetical protein HCN44_009075 [Aphidius gifuensis]